MKILVTGGTNGMGKGVAQILAAQDNQIHEIIILGRSKDLGEATCRELITLTANKKISFVLCDLTKLENVRSAIGKIQSKHQFLDGIFINAGMGYASKRVETEDGMDPHFQVNYLSQFMLTLNLLNLLEKSENGGRVIFNVAKFGEVFWDDIQMEKKWGYEKGVGQGMVCKRMFCIHLHNLCRKVKDSNVSFYGFQIPKTVWTNQINIIPLFMKTMATIMKGFGQFISIEKCGAIMAPLFTESQEASLRRSGKFITQKKNEFIVVNDDAVLDASLQEKLWNISTNLCKDEKTTQIAEALNLQG